MSIQLTNQNIIQLCGMLSYRKGEASCRAGQVTINAYDPVGEHRPTAHFTAVVSAKGSEGVKQVEVELGAGGYVFASCSCSVGFSFDKYCKHAAAVLIRIHDQQRDGTLDQLPGSVGSSASRSAGMELDPGEQRLLNQVMSLFENKPSRPSRARPHFDQRTLLEVEFVCKPLRGKPDQSGWAMLMFGIELRIGPKKRYIVPHIRSFLEQIASGEACPVNRSFSYAPELHAFSPADDVILRKLIDISRQAKLYEASTSHSRPYAHRTTSSHSQQSDRCLLIPPLSWASLMPLLAAAPSAKLAHSEAEAVTLELTSQPLPLHFSFDIASNGLYQLDVSGLQEMTIMESYDVVVASGKIHQLPAKSCERLAELQEMLDRSPNQRIQIPPAHMESFMEKVLPGLRKLGDVEISRAVSERTVHLPLKAKLYLDRIKDRLLAALEFHYGDIVINPLENTSEHHSHDRIVLRNGEQEELIMGLMEQSAFAKTESGYFMQDEEAEFHFLYTTLPQLEKLVDVYATSAVKVRLHPGNVFAKIKVEVDERTDWLNFEFDIKGIPEDDIRQVLEALVEKRRYYRLPSGALLPLESEQLQAMIRVLNATGMLVRELNGTSFRLPAIHSLSLLEEQEQHGASTAITLGTNVKRLLHDIRNPDYGDVQPPAQLAPVLRAYQKYGFQWLSTLARYRLGGILADDMGLGKTLQSISFIAAKLPEIREEHLPALIVAPSSLLYNWHNELRKFTPDIRAVIADGSQAARTRILDNPSEVDVIITSYPLLRRDIRRYAALSFHTLLLDEAQMFKNYATQTAQSVKALQARYRFALTGTPVENSLSELWSIYSVVLPGLFPDRQKFAELPREQVARKIRPFLLRRLKSDVLQELPAKIESQHTSELLPEQKKLYTAYLAKLRQETLAHLANGDLQQSRIRILAGLTRLRQLCCHPALFVEDYTGRSAKFEQLLEVIDECRSAGRRVLIFSQFTTMLGIIGRELGNLGVPFFYLDGQTPAAERVELCERFNTGEKEAFLISLKAGGTGLNLTGADTVILYDLWWNPAVEQQAEDRAHRMGQTQVVHVIRMIAQGTVEEKMYELQQRKKSLIDEIIQPGQASWSSLTEQDIRELLTID